MLSIRPAVVRDVPLLMAMIRELADFERGLDRVTTTETDLARDGFGDRPSFCSLILEWDGEVAGYLICFDFYSSWRGRVLFLEDLYVRPQFRGQGIGKSALAFLAKKARDESYSSLRWEVLDWNRPAIEMYKALGAQFLEDWKLVVLDGDAVMKLAAQAS